MRESNKPAEKQQQKHLQGANLSFKNQVETPKASLFEAITNKIIAVIEAGEANGGITWAGQGASAGLPVNLKTGNPYNGVNVLLLWATAQEKGYSSNYWLTFNQAKEMGGMVRKGEKATTGIFGAPVKLKTPTPTATKPPARPLLLRPSVFLTSNKSTA